MKKLVCLMVLVFMILPIVSADLIPMGFRTVRINNKITNLDDYPDYIFVTGDSPESSEIGMLCPIRIIKENVEIENYYKFCRTSVYAIKKDGIDLNKFNVMGMLDIESNKTKTKEYFDSLDKKEVIKNIKTNTLVRDASVITEIDRYYAIDLEKVKEKPDIINREMNSLPFLYLLIPLISLILIIIILIRRRRCMGY